MFPDSKHLPDAFTNMFSISFMFLYFALCNLMYLHVNLCFFLILFSNVCIQYSTLFYKFIDKNTPSLYSIIFSETISKLFLVLLLLSILLTYLSFHMEFIITWHIIFVLLIDFVFLFFNSLQCSSWGSVICSLALAVIFLNDFIIYSHLFISLRIFDCSIEDSQIDIDECNIPLFSSMSERYKFYCLIF